MYVCIYHVYILYHKYTSVCLTIYICKTSLVANKYNTVVLPVIYQYVLLSKISFEASELIIISLLSRSAYSTSHGSVHSFRKCSV